ncbi:metal-dependent hydrolase [Brevibacterium album]|uniref:metal-dependent hydrolase n=1 Tax=Brevibacterium album TaxID=417948 RepID=UPI0004048B4C|nr:metal-dependent hydrolase [Brevibacterium album]
MHEVPAIAETRVSYPDGALASTGAVVHVEAGEQGGWAVVLDRTAFHPVDASWPDQPADRGIMRSGDSELSIITAVTGGFQDGVLVYGENLSARLGTPGWTFCVVHLVDGPPPQVGAEVRIDVDEEHRAALSAGHTACHLAALALDAALADAWGKPVNVDSLGNPAFDSLAVQRSAIEEFSSVDVYRVGKSLRRKGFRPEALEDLESLAHRINWILGAWVSTGATVSIERAGDELSARRTWTCRLPEKTATIPCGGTHLRSLSELSSIEVSLDATQVPGGTALVMRTTAVPHQ